MLANLNDRAANGQLFLPLSQCCPRSHGGLSELEALKIMATLNDWRKEAEDEQQEYCNRLGGRLYDEYFTQNPQYLQTKVAFAMLGPPQWLPDVMEAEDMLDLCSWGALLWPEKQRDLIINMTDFIIKCTGRIESDKNGESLKIAFIFVTGNTPKDGRYSAPVIRIHEGSVPGFVDTSCRYYKDWNDYLKNNTLPPSDYIYPDKGVYSMNSSGKVVLGQGKTPAGLTKRKVLNKVDTLGGWLGLGSAVVCAGSTFLFPPVALGAAVVGASTGFWAGARSIASLIDKKSHQQSLSPLDTAARADWLMIAGGAVGIASSATLAYMKFAASSGRTLSLASKGVAAGVQGANVAVNGLSAVNATYRIIRKSGPAEPLEMLQMAVAVYFFSNALVNFKLPTEFISEVQDATLQNHSSKLSKSRRSAFDAKVNEAMESPNPVAAKAEIIKGINIQPTNRNVVFTNNISTKSPQSIMASQTHMECLGRLKSAFQVNSLRDIVVNGSYPLQNAQPSEMRVFENAIMILLRFAADRASELKLIHMLQSIIVKYDPRNPNSLNNLVKALVTFISYFTLTNRNVPLNERFRRAVERSFPEFLNLVDELKERFTSAMECVVEFVRRQGGGDERALEAALTMGRMPEEEAVATEAEGSLLERCLAAGARFLNQPSLTMEDIAEHSIEPGLVNFNFHETKSDALGVTGFTVRLSEGAQIEGLSIDFAPSPTSPGPAVKRLCCE